MGSSLTPKGGSPSAWKHLLIRVDAALMSLRVRGDRSHARGGGRQQDRDGLRVPRDDHRAFRPDLIYIGAQERFDICEWGDLHGSNSSPPMDSRWPSLTLTAMILTVDLEASCRGGRVDGCREIAKPRAKARRFAVDHHRGVTCNPCPSLTRPS